jgi:uncharacterized Zn-finger protein
MGYEYKKNADGHFVCPHCGETKRLQSTMHYHMKRHEGKLPHECKLCNKSFLHASTLELHKKAQHQKEQERMFKCPMPGCPYEGTLTKANLLIHYVRKHCKAEATASIAPASTSAAPQCVHCGKECKSLTAFHYHLVGCMPLEDANRQNHLAAIQTN